MRLAIYKHDLYACCLYSLSINVTIADYMYNRFTKPKRTGRRRISPTMRREVFHRDQNTCQFCGAIESRDKLTIDHLVPLAHGGMDEMINYVTACRDCNAKKRDLSLQEFARTIDIDVSDLPVHGDPIITNIEIPAVIRAIRQRVINSYRAGEFSLRGRGGQNKFEKIYRREVWESSVGKGLTDRHPELPGPVRIMIPEIDTIASNQREKDLLIELAKSANTRNLIGSVLKSEMNIEVVVETLADRERDSALGKRLNQAIKRFHKIYRSKFPK